jgi:signal peptidase II
VTGVTNQDGGGELERSDAASSSGVPVDTDRPGSPPDAKAATGRPAWPLFATVAGTILIADQLTKAWVVGTVAQGTGVQVLGDLIRVIHSRNNGALFGLFGSSAPILALASVVVLGAIVWYHGHAGRNLLVSIALGLLLGGALGNLADRIHYGYVVDWVDMGIGTLRFWTYNLGDAGISVAILLLLLIAVRPSLGTAARDD